MSIYVLDTSSILVMQSYFPGAFPTFWKSLDTLVGLGQVFSVRECLREINNRGTQQHLLDWVDLNKHIFRVPNQAETRFVSQVFDHFQPAQIVKQKAVLEGTPVADPFVVAAGKIHGACVVTEESLKPQASRIPNVCRHFHIDYANMEGMLSREGWKF